jgi:hypothetical protein
LDFLDEGKSYKATVYYDDASLKSTTRVGKEEFTVDASESIGRKVLGSNGMALILEPVE